MCWFTAKSFRLWELLVQSFLSRQWSLSQTEQRCPWCWNTIHPWTVLILDRDLLTRSHSPFIARLIHPSVSHSPVADKKGKQTTKPSTAMWDAFFCKAKQIWCLLQHTMGHVSSSNFYSTVLKLWQHNHASLTWASLFRSPEKTPKRGRSWKNSRCCTRATFPVNKKLFL